MSKRPLTREEKRRRRERKAAFMTVFVNGRQKRVRRPPLIDGIPADEFVARNADPLWLQQNEMWEFIPLDEASGADADTLSPSHTRNSKPVTPDQDVLPM